MVGLAEALKDKAEVSVVAGYRDELFFTEELKMPESFILQPKMEVREQKVR
ncbi:MAG: hypothetical protein ACLT2Z_08100 [Eubacterium sp.]